MRRIGVTETIERVDLIFRGVDGVAEAHGRGLTHARQSGLNYRSKRLEVVGLRKVESELRRGAVRQADTTVVLEEIFDDVAHIEVGLAAEIEGMDVVGDVLQDIVADAL